MTSGINPFQTARRKAGTNVTKKGPIAHDLQHPHLGPERYRQRFQKVMLFLFHMRSENHILVPEPCGNSGIEHLVDIGDHLEK